MKTLGTFLETIGSQDPGDFLDFIHGQVIEHESGKIDRKRLPPMPVRRDAGRRTEQEYAAPRTPVEEILAGIFEEVLKLDRIGVRDHFFEIGGHSLLATQVVSRVRTAFGVEIHVGALPSGDGTLNQYDWGGYLIAFAPRTPVFIDGRLFPYVPDVLADYRAIVGARPGWESVVARRGVTTLLVRPTDPIAVRAPGQRILIATGEIPQAVSATYDLSEIGPLASIAGAMATLFSPDRTILVTGEPPAGAERLEIVLSEQDLRQAMLIYSRNILILSLVISVITAALVYLALTIMIVRPIERLAANMTGFSAAPEEAGRVIEPSGRSDEIGVAEERLAAMQKALRETLHQRRHLADLGLAVSKINHDLRNILASAQLFSDRLGAVDDPLVKRLAPKVISAIDRAIGYTRSVLAYGQAREEPPQRRLVSLRRLADDVADVLGLPVNERVGWENRLGPDLTMDSDPDQLFRAVLNICRNALEALETSDDPAVVRRLWLEGERQGSVVRLRICDTGPGIPPRARGNLFQPFHGSAKPGGTGVGPGANR